MKRIDRAVTAVGPPRRKLTPQERQERLEAQQKEDQDIRERDEIWFNRSGPVVPNGARVVPLWMKWNKRVPFLTNGMRSMLVVPRTDPDDPAFPERLRAILHIKNRPWTEGYARQLETRDSYFIFGYNKLLYEFDPSRQVLIDGRGKEKSLHGMMQYMNLLGAARVLDIDKILENVHRPSRLDVDWRPSEMLPEDFYGA